MDKQIFAGMMTGFSDFPGKYAVSLFFPGCNLRCPFCYNKRLWTDPPVLSLRDVLRHLERLTGTTPGHPPAVVLSGGEPTVHPDMSRVVRELHGKYKLGLHTNGLVVPGAAFVYGRPFDSVILSVKHPYLVEPVCSEADYAPRLVSAMRAYNAASHKELRIVVPKGLREMHTTVLSQLDTQGWKVNYVEPFVPPV